jgi:hypothetical protein
VHFGDAFLAIAPFQSENKKPTCQFNPWRWVTWIRQFC